MALPSDVLRSISYLIDEFGDYVRFDSVLRKICPLGNTRQLQMLRNFPWLIIDVTDTTKLLFFFSGHHFIPVWTPVRIIQKVTIFQKVTRCFGSSFGWLIIGDWDWPEWEKRCLQLCLVNPCTNRRIKLPPYTPTLHSITVDDTKVIMSSSPEDSSIIVVIKEHLGYVSFYRLGDEDWTYEHDDDGGSEDIIFFNGFLYGVDYENCTEVVTYGFADDRTVSRSLFLLEEHSEFSKFNKESCSTHAFLMESDERFLLVIEDSEENHKFGVFWLNFEERRWIKLTSLGDHMILLSHCCSVSLDAAKFIEFGFRPNCIYFSKDRYYEYGWQEFCLEDKRIVPFEVDFSTILPLPPVEEEEAN